jgi:hypothetical protein
MDAETKDASEAMEQRILQRIETVETRLLSAFHGWSTTMELRVKGLPVIDQRLAVIEDRVSTLERKNLERGL